MLQRLSMDEVYRIDGYGLVITFSDGTYARYTVEEMSRMRPGREKLEKVKTKQDLLTS